MYNSVRLPHPESRTMTDPKHRIELDIGGLDCADCALTLEKGVSALPGVQGCDLSFATGRLRVTGDVECEDVADRVAQLGYEVLEPAADDEPTAHARAGGFLRYLTSRTEGRLALLGTLFVVPAVVLGELGGMELVVLDALSIAAAAVAGAHVARRAVSVLRFNREVNIDVLMTIAAAGAIVIGAYTEAGMVMVLYGVGSALEGYTAGRARDSVRRLMQVVPSTATRIHRHGGVQRQTRVSVSSLRVGDCIAVLPGERIPMDGLVREGSSHVNQAPITGESRLVEKAVGTKVFAGSINGEGALEIEVVRLAEDNTISRMVELVAEAQEAKAPVERFVDRFARVYTPAVVGLALIVAALPPLLFDEPFWNVADGTTGWLYRGLALLVVACPCALVISTPVAVVSAITNGARSGVLVKGGEALEVFSGVRAVAVDKTGTLTEGRPSVVGVRAADCMGSDCAHQLPCRACDDVLALASAVEKRSDHPIARAVVREAERHGLDESYPTAVKVTALAGLGISGIVAGREVLIGSHELFDETIDHSPEACEAVSRETTMGHSAMMVSAAGRFAGAIIVSDTVRATSRQAIDGLRAQGIEAIAMLTGDGEQAAMAVGRKVGIRDIRWGLRPEEKVRAVDELRSAYGRVAMVGDGINDAPSLATADVGIAVGAATGPTTQAMETADIALLADDLRRLPFSLRLARAAMSTIRLNVAASVLVKLAFLALVLAGLGTMWMAVLADMGTSLAVTLFGMRLLQLPRFA